jgi:hypothetical protein
MYDSAAQWDIYLILLLARSLGGQSDDVMSAE